jgi:hypothetical protein
MVKMMMMMMMYDDDHLNPATWYFLWLCISCRNNRIIYILSSQHNYTRETYMTQMCRLQSHLIFILLCITRSNRRIIHILISHSIWISLTRETHVIQMCRLQFTVHFCSRYERLLIFLLSNII